MSCTLRALLLVLCVSFCANAQTRTLALYLGPASGIDTKTQRMMRAELQQLLAPAAIDVVWKTLADRKGDENFDIVVANILTSALLALAPLLASRARAGGSIALCGILAPQADAVIETYRHWFDISTWQSIDGWSLLEGVRR